MTTTWYAILTKPRSEYALHLELLGGKIAQTLFLHYTAAINHGRKIVHAIRPYLPRYLFVGVDPTEQTTQGTQQAIGTICDHRLVSDVLGNSQGPIPIPHQILQEFSTQSGADTFGNIPKLSEFQRELIATGSTIRVLAGAFEGFTGEVSLDEGDKIRVWLTMFGRPCETPLAPSQIEVVSPKGRLVTSDNPEKHP